MQVSTRSITDRAYLTCAIDVIDEVTAEVRAQMSDATHPELAAAVKDRLPGVDLECAVNARWALQRDAYIETVREWERDQLEVDLAELRRQGVAAA